MPDLGLAAIETRFAAGHVAQCVGHCYYCGHLVPALVAEVRRLRAVHYLPMDCPACGRHRLEYDPVAHRIRCEKCGSENWEHPERAE